MKELLVATRPEPGVVSSKPALELAGWKASSASWDAFRSLRHLPEITLISFKLDALDIPAKDFVQHLADKQIKSHDVAMILCHIEAMDRPDSTVLTSLLRPFPHPERIEFRWTRQGLHNSDIQEYLAEIAPKLELLQEMEAAQPTLPARRGPLDGLGSITASTRSLRTPGGRLSAVFVADLYDVPLSRLAGWLGRNRQTIFKTPDAESLQPALEYLDRVARLLVVLSASDFRKWLRAPNSLLEGARPLDLIAGGKWQIVADLVEDMLTGNPT